MKVIKVDPDNPEKEKMAMVRDTLSGGGTVVYPTDTVYGLGANLFHEDALQNVYLMKRRPLNKPISLCVSKVEDIQQVAHLNPQLDGIIKKILPGPYTLILNKKEIVPLLITGGTDKIGVRIPDNSICREISREFPITTTSANISGHPSPVSAQEARKDLDDHPDILIDSGPCSGGISSTVVDLTVSPPRILREGAGMEKLLQFME
ncbi:L-threonylcarbamoyladenylate synthase [Methanobacterium formicicum]|uniref:L-threonylcarbamoyladenylate synthase n=1 Tax=Methanobacterium formicicum (strain DSM 3637 / PP1) TaxID=1204725 RepID=K2RRU8_METFP|nr:L-threonylcarbamoyladenylate synthase [Methanobacterium formicicum]EKF85465.1 Sua5/YciO/YrdC/YwlC family protein [Methanobacterium formicicum DSM 3637]